ncbi:MarR family winged helix-turn-helix transcriptional regulator [Paenibacillus thailandensis]|uniref:MarR family winged helix-turn-helix transcriptional regulator n=1 Tax=Paenibacillus thailandensis TaxID=393250 RepID=A0ABW5R502_9BACL
MERSEQLQLDRQVCFSLYACSREVTKVYRPFLDKMGLTYTQYITMLALWEEDNVPVKTLGERLYLDSGTLTPLLKKLEAAGLIVRERDAKDERSVLVRLTGQGKALREQALDLPYELFCRTGLAPEQLEELRKTLQTLTRTIHSRLQEEERG